PAPVEQAKAPVPEAQPAPASPSVNRGPLRIPAGSGVGAAAFRRGELGVVVLDERLPVELDQLELPEGFAEARLTPLGKATILTVKLAEDESLALVREPGAWLVSRSSPAGQAVAPEPVPDGIAFPFPQPGRALAVRDPVTGQTLLVGTSRQPSGPGPAVPSGRTAPGYALLPTWLGLALEPNSDQVDLRVSLSGFTLVTPDSASPVKTASANRESRFGLPTGPEKALLQQLRAHVAAAAGMPPRGRGPERVEAAKTMLSLGMASEAQALLALAAEDDPAVAADPMLAALSGVAAVLAGRPGEAATLDNPALDANDELAFWRGLRDAAAGKPTALPAGSVGVALVYPEAIQQRILPRAVEAAVLNGEPAFDKVPDSPSLAFAHALAHQRAGETDAALEAFDAIDRGRDGSDSVRAALAAAELRLATGRIAPAAAADIVERQTLRWRGDARELAARLRLAELRTKAGLWRAALDSLRETETVFPSAKPDVASRKAGVFKTLLASPREDVRPLDLVGLAGDFADCVPDGAAGQAIAALLADKLAALDLPSRAVPVLQKLMQEAPSTAAKAEFGLRLAQLQLDAGEPAKAEAVLNQAEPTGGEQAESRAMLLARARAEQGDAAGAAKMLIAMASPAADELRASILAKSGDWKGSLAALKDLAVKSVPGQGELTDQQQDVLLREATAAAQAGDAAALSELKRAAPRISGARADMFKVLTASALQGTGDLPRAARELAMSRSFPERADALTHR
ncbi:MAG TPA: hypothetical protein VE650_16645, partial [Acetobacteraceae bacterium]|nr:hypothetical protein [Acetobacteraceae bacterium]